MLERLGFNPGHVEGQPFVRLVLKEHRAEMLAALAALQPGEGSRLGTGLIDGRMVSVAVELFGWRPRVAPQSILVLVPPPDATCPPPPAASTFLQDMLDALDETVLVSDEGYRWVFLNDRACALLGGRRETLLFTSKAPEISPEALERLQRTADRVRSSGRRQQEELALDKETGGRVLALEHSLWIDPHSRQSFVICTGHEVTEAHVWRDQLNERADMLAELNAMALRLGRSKENAELVSGLVLTARRLARARVALYFEPEKSSGFLHVRTVDGDLEYHRLRDEPSVAALNRLKVPQSEELREWLLANAVATLPGPTDLFPEGCVLDPALSTVLDLGQVLRLVFHDGREVLAVLALLLPGQSRLAVHDLFETFVGLASSLLQRVEAEKRLHQSLTSFGHLVEYGLDGIVVFLEGEEHPTYLNETARRMLDLAPGTMGLPPGVREGGEVPILRGEEGAGLAEVRVTRITWIGQHARLAVLHDVTEQREQRQRIEASLREKEVLLQEIHHRVKNNLAIVSSLLALQQREVADPAMRGLLLESRNRIQTMALIHERLYRSEDLAKVGMAEYLASLVTYLKRSYNLNPRLRLTASVEAGLVLSASRAIPCGLIVNELVANAIKHAFPNDRAGSIEVLLRRCPDDLLELSVKDDGVGSSNELRAGGSLGKVIVASLGEQLGATLENGPSPGTKVILRFPS